MPAPPLPEVLRGAAGETGKNERPRTESPDAQRLQKLMARAGIASRRAAEELIAQGRVSINGHIERELGAKADPAVDKILVDGRPLALPTSTTVVLFHKPAGVVTTKSDPEGRTTFLDYLPKKYHSLHSIGRLDFDTSGVLLLTDDGELTQLLTHPSHGAEKVYWARVAGTVSVATLKQLEAGIWLDDGKTAPCRARVRAQTEKNALVQLTLTEGKNRQVRRMMEAVGHPVRALRRVRFAEVELEGLLSGAHRELIGGEVHALKKYAEKPKRDKTPRRKPAPKVGAKATPKTAPEAKPLKPDAASKDFVKPGGGQKKRDDPRGKSPVAARVEKRWGQQTRKHG